MQQPAMLHAMHQTPQLMHAQQMLHETQHRFDRHLAAPRVLRGDMRRRIVALLQTHPEGLTPAKVRTLLGVDKSLADTCLRMLHYGLLQRVEQGRYVRA